MECEERSDVVFHPRPSLIRLNPLFWSSRALMWGVNSASNVHISRGIYRHEHAVDIDEARCICWGRRGAWPRAETSCTLKHVYALLLCHKQLASMDKQGHLERTWYEAQPMRGVKQAWIPWSG